MTFSLASKSFAGALVMTSGSARGHDYMLVRHKVRDFSEWKRGYGAHLPKRVEAGLTEKYLLRGAYEPSEVIAFFEVKDLNRAKAFAESVDLKEAMQKLGVVDRPDIYFLNG
jgi:hypothetical protein